MYPDINISNSDISWKLISKVYHLAMLYIMLGDNVLGRFYRNTSNNNSILTTQRCNIEFTVSMWIKEYK